MAVMKKLISANAGPYKDGVAAYARQDYVTAAKLMRVAADQGNAVAQYNLGVMYYEGECVTQDYKEAVKWYRLSADQGNASAQYYLGVMYDNGQGVTQHYVRAHMWMNIAASAGNKTAQSDCNVVAKKMSRAQIGKAQEMAWRCMESKYKQYD